MGRLSSGAWDWLGNGEAGTAGVPLPGCPPDTELPSAGDGAGVADVDAGEPGTVPAGSVAG